MRAATPDATMRLHCNLDTVLVHVREDGDPIDLYMWVQPTTPSSALLRAAARQQWDKVEAMLQSDTNPVCALEGAELHTLLCQAGPLATYLMALAVHRCPCTGVGTYPMAIQQR